MPWWTISRDRGGVSLSYLLAFQIITPLPQLLDGGGKSFLVEGSDLDDNNYDGDIINTQWIMGLGSGV